MNSISIDIAAIIVVCSIILYFYGNYAFTYWKRRGFPFLSPTFPFGNFAPSFWQQKSIGVLAEDFYNATSEPFSGIYAMFRPILLVRDPELLRHIFVKDFTHFMDRGVFMDEKRDPLSATLFSMSGEKWKNLRTKLTPVYTSGKLKAMFSTIVRCGEFLENYMEREANEERSFEGREICARYTTDIIASVAFGIDINSIEQPDIPFRRYGRKVCNVANQLIFVE